MSELNNLINDEKQENVPEVCDAPAADAAAENILVGAEANSGEKPEEAVQADPEGNVIPEAAAPAGEEAAQESDNDAPENAGKASCENDSGDKAAEPAAGHESEEQKAEQSKEAAAAVKSDVPVIQKPKPLPNDEVLKRTALLWKYFPIPENEPEPFPEYVNKTYDLPGGKVIAARVRGKKHKHEGTNCDDWFEVANLDRITFIAVSDGAGSKKFSRIGARESCRVAVGYLVSTVEKTFKDRPELKANLSLALTDPRCMEACGVLAGVVQQSVIKAHEAVENAFYSRRTDPEYEKVLGRGLQLKDLSGTLLIAMMVPVSDTTKEHLVISCQIGDGMIAILNSKGEFGNSMKLMGVPDSGDFSGETDFLTSAQMKNLEKLQLRTKLSRTTVDTVMVMTDGVADDYFPNEKEMRRLYFDLILNGIIYRTEKDLSMFTLTQAQMKQFKRIPDPLVYPWVNDQSVEVPIHYTNRIEEAMGLTLEDIWNDPMVLDLARIELGDANKNTDPSERLKVWLDNYVERGSFDDRTLVVMKI